ncbi:MAG: nickel insertion protein [Pseudoramibacter sp.]
MAKQLYFECSSGISGDMAVGAMLDLGADRAVLMQALDSLPLSGYTIEIGRRAAAGIDACDFDVRARRAAGQPRSRYGLSLRRAGHHDHGHHHDHDHDHGDHSHDTAITTTITATCTAPWPRSNRFWPAAP